jgi:UDP-glucose 4-epimerase
MIRGQTIVITGGAGFIGTSLAERLCDANQVVLFDNFARDSLQYSPVAKHANVRIIKGDVMDYAGVRAVVEGAHIVVHAAAIAGIDTVLKSPVRTMEINMIGTANVLRACADAKVAGRVLDLSTSEVLGSMAFRVREDQQTVAGSAGEARWVYAVSKLAGEHLAHSYYRERGLPCVTVRPFNIYGPGQTGEGALQIFVRRALENQPITIYGDGSQIRAWCYVDDMIAALGLALERPEAIGESFNIGNARAVTTIYHLATTVCRVLGSSSTITFKPPLSADIELRIPETVKAEKLLGFKAKVELEEGIARTADWYRRFRGVVRAAG